VYWPFQQLRIKVADNPTFRELRLGAIVDFGEPVQASTLNGTYARWLGDPAAPATGTQPLHNGLVIRITALGLEAK
jgi:hypothetical protein